MAVLEKHVQGGSEATAKSLGRLALLLTQRQLDVQKGFAELDQHRRGSLEATQLVLI